MAVKIKWIDVSSISQVLKSVNFGPKEIGIISLIIVSGILIYTVLYIFVGTTIKSADQIQFAQLPVAAVVLVGYMITVLCMQNTDSLFTQICTYIPVFSPFLAVNTLFREGSHTLEYLFMGLSTIGFLILGNIAIIKFYKKENQ